MKRILIPVLIFIIGISIYQYMHKKNLERFEQEMNDLPVTEAVTVPTQQSKPSEAAQNITAPAAAADAAHVAKTKAEKVSIREATPAVEKLKEEVAADPHSTPKSLIGFSIQIGERMDAVKSESDATTLFKELEDCMMDKSNSKAQSVQALCLLNARRLSNKYETLKPSYSSLATGADPRVLELSKLTE